MMGWNDALLSREGRMMVGKGWQQINDIEKKQAKAQARQKMMRI